MRRDKKPFVRWISEAVFIFLSVFGAFYFDNLREERNERRLYLNYLSDFRSDLKTNQLRFEKELAVSLDITWGGDYLKGRLRDLNQIDSLLTHPSRINAEMIIDILEREGIGRTSRWIFQSPHYDKLNGDYYSFIKNDALKNRLRLHHRNNQNRYNLKEFIDTEVTYFEYQVVNELDFTKNNTTQNRTVLFGSKSINQIKKLKRLFTRLIDITQFGLDSDKLLLEQVDIELESWGETS